jgi:hypothetical protein
VYNFYQGLKKALGFCLSEWALRCNQLKKVIPSGCSVYLDKQTTYPVLSRESSKASVASNSSAFRGFIAKPACVLTRYQ